MVSALADPLWRKPLVTPYLRGDDGPEGENCTLQCNFQVVSFRAKSGFIKKLDSEQSTNIMLTIRISNKIGSSAESVDRSARIYHGGTETQASPKRFAEASTEKRLSRCAKRDRDNDLLLEQDESQFIMIEDLHITSAAIKSPLVFLPEADPLRRNLRASVVSLSFTLKLRNEHSAGGNNMDTENTRAFSATGGSARGMKSL